ncbi:4Fe-4S binding protein [Halarcobacter sp.]|uniref:4Fe-4S binding protein n=1 Tax=Halarcobacter sp. TaxID=2321133 RepID=UPI002AA7D797|nr:4Fe-4S binding protein [Halarcobacter sp.]
MKCIYSRDSNCGPASDMPYCYNICPVDAISIHYTNPDHAWIDPNTCISCGGCVLVCPSQAIKEG